MPLPECAQLPQDGALVRTVEDVLQEPAERIAPQELASLKCAEGPRIVVVVLWASEIRRVAGIDRVHERHVLRSAADDLQKAVHHADVGLALPFRRQERPPVVVGLANRLQRRRIPFVPPSAAARRMGMSRIVARLPFRRADLVQEERCRAQLAEDAPGKALHHAAPRRAGRAHDRKRRRPRRVLLYRPRAVHLHHGIRLGHQEPRSRCAPQATVGIGHRHLPDRLAEGDALPRAGLRGEVFGIVDVMPRMLPEVPVKPRRKIREHRLCPDQNVGDLSRMAVYVDPKRDLRHPTRICRNVLDGALRAPFLLQGECPVPPCRRPPVALEGSRHNGVARAFGRLSRHSAPFDRRMEANVLLAVNHHRLLPGIRVLRSQIEPVRADKGGGNLRIVPEILEARLFRTSRTIPEKAGAVILPRQHHIRLAVRSQAAKPREISRQQRPLLGAVVKPQAPGERSVRAPVYDDLGIQSSPLRPKRQIAPCKDDLRIRLPIGPRRCHGRRNRQTLLPIRAGGELRRPQLAAARRERRLARADVPQHVRAVKRHFHSGMCRGCAGEQHPRDRQCPCCLHVPHSARIVADAHLRT